VCVMADILSELRLELKHQADEKTAASFHRFFKEDVTYYGVKTDLVNKLANRYYQTIKGLDKKEIFRLCEELLKSDYTEEAFIACEWAYKLHASYETGDFPVFERWLKKYINNWAKCDTLCNHTIGSFVTRFPQYVEKLKEWAKSDNRWVKRAAAVTLIIPAKEGLFLPDIFQIADILLTDTDDMVQKGYGWMLKEACRQHEKEVFDYVMRNKAVMPRTALRYAIEKMPADLKGQAMAKG
ncbi:MAG TPA: DNA alkylation repair protein, partial [Dehalococcoidales bacterium]